MVKQGEKEWDGPFCLADMLEIPEKLKPLVSDYKMNLLQLRKSGSLRFHNQDVDTVFDVSRSIYEKDFQTMTVNHCLKKTQYHFSISIQNTHVKY